jgi:hypothetical protein
MTFKIQRVARGLGNLLNTFGGQTPAELEDKVRSCIDTLQFYGLQQYQRRTDTNGTLAEAGLLTITVPANEHWILFDVGATIAMPAAITELQYSIHIGAAGQTVPIFQERYTVSAANAFFAGGLMLPYPRVLLPTWTVILGLNSLVGAANANVSLFASVGILG